MKLENLPPHPGNPRKITPEKLTDFAASMEKFGPLYGFVFNRRFARLISGHQSQKVLPKDSGIIIEKKFDEPTRTGTVALGWIIAGEERAPYREVDVDEDTEKAMNIAANAHGGDWDKPKVAEYL